MSLKGPPSRPADPVRRSLSSDRSAELVKRGTQGKASRRAPDLRDLRGGGKAWRSTSREMLDVAGFSIEGGQRRAVHPCFAPPQRDRPGIEDLPIQPLRSSRVADSVSASVAARVSSGANPDGVSSALPKESSSRKSSSAAVASEEAVRALHLAVTGLLGAFEEDQRERAERCKEERQERAMHHMQQREFAEANGRLLQDLVSQFNSLSRQLNDTARSRGGGW